MNRPAMFYRWLSVIALGTLCACTQSNTAASPPAAGAQETARMAPVVEKYKKQQVVTGFDVKGTDLVVYTDTEKFSEMDDSSEAAMKSDLLARWTATWKSGHPHAHAKLHVIFQNYYGQEITRLEKRV